MKKIPLIEFDVIFISYDEPNADENWADLLKKCPWAKRSHGVYGSDAAHKAAANLSETERFIGIDADNIIDPAIFSLEYDERIIKSNSVFSFKGKNNLNGLVYGNGGIKCWPVKTVLEMKTHEATKSSDKKSSQIEFCWDINYQQQNKIFSRIFNHSSPLQAFRAGFREGCKMSLNEGELIPKTDFLKKIYPDNLKRLRIWSSIGSDIENGLWAIYGARLGFIMTNLENWDYINVRDFEYINRFWKEEVYPKFKGNEKKCPRTNYTWNESKLIKEIEKLGLLMSEEYNLDVVLFKPEESKFIKDNII